MTIRRGVVAWQEARQGSGGLLTGWETKMMDARAARCEQRQGERGAGERIEREGEDTR